MKFGDYIRHCRERLAWTQPEAAKNIKIEQSYLSKLETGKSYPSDDIFEKLVETYSIDIDDLYSNIQSEELEKLKGIKDFRAFILSKQNQQRKDERFWLILGLVMLIIGGAATGHALIPSQASTEYLYRSDGELKPNEPLDTFDIIHQDVSNLPDAESLLARQKTLLPRIHQMEFSTYEDRG